MTKQLETFGIFVDRFMNFMNIWTIYSDLLSGHYVPSVGKALRTPQEVEDTTARQWPVNFTMMFLLYGYFYSLVEDSEDAVNGFRLWRERHPDEKAAIDAVEAQVAPFRERLRLFRNRLAFHGSQSRSHESRGFELFKEHSGNEVLDAIKNFKSLGAALFAKENAGQGIGPTTSEMVRQWIDRLADRARAVVGGVRP
jgi:hypothetical protein